MKHLKTFENLNTYKVGDYVLLDLTKIKQKHQQILHHQQKMR